MNRQRNLKRQRQDNDINDPKRIKKRNKYKNRIRKRKTQIIKVTN